MGYKMGKLGNWKSGQDLKSEQKKKTETKWGKSNFKSGKNDFKSGQKLKIRAREIENEAVISNRTRDYKLVENNNYCMYF